MTADVAPLEVVRPHPLCAETPLPLLQHAVTPAESVYVRSNFDTPVAHEAWTLSVNGAVSRGRLFTLDDLAALPQRELLVTMECAGNWRLSMEPVPVGEPWRDGAVSTTSWRGVSLADVLTAVAVHPDAIEVVARGADAGARDDAEGPVRFERALPLTTAMHPDTLLATHMDGAPLTPDHGAPLRLIVPNWYGMANVKWLAELELVTTPFAGYFQTQRYVYDVDGRTTPVTRALVKSLIVSPVPGALDSGAVTVRGWAWSGGGPITRVEVAVNDWWTEAALGAPASAYAWTPFEVPVVLPAGEVVLRSRATDASGATQPDRIVWNRLGYGNNGVRTVRVVVAP